MSAISVPQILVGIHRYRAVAAARYVTQQCGAARVHAINRRANVALRFRQRGRDYEIQLFADGNRNGVRAVDIAAGLDVPLAPPEQLNQNFPGVRIGIAEGLGTDAVKAGTSGLLSFTSLSTATPGSVFVLGKDGTQFAVRVLGTTARTRLERYDPRQQKWVSTW